jgi:hypothetical protein
MLHQVHGHPQLRLPQAQDTQGHRDHHRGGQRSAGTKLRTGQHRAGRCHSHRGQVKRAKPPINLDVIRPGHAPSSGAFKAVEDTKAMQIDVEDPAKTVQIGTGLNRK